MPIKVKVSVRQEEVQWQGTNLIVPFLAEPRGGFPIQGSSVVFPADNFTSAQAAAQFKNQVIAWIASVPEYAGLGSLAANDVSVIGGFQ